MWFTIATHKAKRAEPQLARGQLPHPSSQGYQEVTHMPMTNPKKKVKCPACNGRGFTTALLGQTKFPCKPCKGEGKVDK